MLPRNTPDLPRLFGDVVRFEIELWDAVDARLKAECDLPLGRFLPMRVVARRPGCRVQDIAEELRVTVGGISKVVDRVEAAGHCARRPNPDDKRSSLIHLTPAGERLLARAEETFATELDRLLGDALPPGGLADFAAVLTRLQAALSAKPPAEQPPTRKPPAEQPPAANPRSERSPR
jgi:DNA-binding MarR family transcriptional regulator